MSVLSVRPQRLVSLDAIRGVAVMGILIANLPGFALPEAAYSSPLAWGGSQGWDRIAWFATYVLVEAKLRGLFSFLFGASMLIVIDAARAGGDDPVTVHYSRMAWLFAIGLAHLYLLWWGDILAHYALVGALAYPLARAPTRWLLAAGAVLIAVQTLVGADLYWSAVAAAAQDTPAHARTWLALSDAFGRPTSAALATELSVHRGGYLALLRWRLTHAGDPVADLPYSGAETLGFMLFGMAGLRSGFLTGSWPRRTYARIAILTLGATLPLYAALGLHTIARGYDVRSVLLGLLVAPVPLRPVTIAGYAALVMLAVRPGGRLTARIAAAGRAAFTNYLGTSLIMTTLFYGYGLGLFGRLSRAELYLVVPVVWAVMLAWSKPWLARYRYGPLEWTWRTLARFSLQPMRRPAPSD